MKLEKVTARQKPTEKRRINDACGTAHALELIGERWALLVVRELMLGPRRFGEIKADLPGISANVLTQRLEELEQRGLLTRHKLPPPASVQVYELTAWGYEAEPIIQVMGRWATRSPLHDPTRQISGVSVLLSFRTMLDLSRIGDIDASIGFRFGEDRYLGCLNANGFTVARGDPDGADLIFTGQPAALAGAVYGGVPFETLATAGMLEVKGDRALADKFITLFPLPEKIPPPPMCG
ncbi:winged helix-turn-helix transcriptional regulator [Sphingobium phenoxybenzoativorans]|uniref:winged helix-turn-helix transcriptional regulator n=1 Tax=Sphingobium phenoxybenzoativorans TaxID=1592790 RepID=UPI000871E617|nr:winged helix-turn-helix transcriptional regulator [Sphingobium phenoxybenzoativorans]